jgi:hypothetical protein
VGRPAILEESSDTKYQVGWLVPTASKIPRDPIIVRVTKTEKGWRGWEVGGDLAKHSTHYYAELWKWATPEQAREFDEKFNMNSVELNRAAAELGTTLEPI